jgi:hypothetical protein
LVDGEDAARAGDPHAQVRGDGQELLGGGAELACHVADLRERGNEVEMA